MREGSRKQGQAKKGRSPGDDLSILIGILEGGPGSGFHGHRGRPGEVGGSMPGEGASAAAEPIPEKKKFVRVWNPIAAITKPGELYPEEKAVFGSLEVVQGPEKLLVMNQNGKRLAVVNGKKNEVTIPQEVAGLLRDGILTHNHSNNSAFSKNDWLACANAGVHEMRVITKDKIYSVTGLDKVDFILVKWLAGRVDRNLFRSRGKEIQAGKLDPNDAEREFYHEFSVEMARQLHVEYHAWDRV